MVATPSGASGGGFRPAESTGGFTAVDAGITADGVVEGAKSVTGKLAQSDPALLGRTDETPVNVMVKLDYDAVRRTTRATSPASRPRVRWSPAPN